jgi:aubergine
VLLNVDIIHKVLRTDKVLDFINDIKNKTRNGDPQNEVRKALVGCTILTSYNKRTYKVDDVDFSMSPKDSFTIDAVQEGDDSKTVTYAEYFKSKYEAEVRDMN